MPHQNKSNKSFFFIGDLALSGDIRMEDLDQICLPLNQIMGKGDFLFANLEIPITHESFQPVHRGNEVVMESGLAKLGLTHINLANNHILDAGKEGLSATISMLQRLNIKFTGAGLLPEHCEPMILEWNGRNVAILGYVHPSTNIKNLDTQGVYVNVWNAEKAKRQIVSLKASGFDVWVSLHWGVDYSHFVEPLQKQIANDIALWGGSLILGHHAHVVQPMQNKNDSVLFYGLGGYVFGHFWKNNQWCSLFKKTKRGLIVEARMNHQEELHFYYFSTRESWNHRLEIATWDFSSWSNWYWFWGNFKYSSSGFKKLFSIFENQCCKISHQTSMFGTSVWSRWLRGIKSGE